MYKDRKFKLGIHTYTLHLSGLGQNWGFVGDHFKQAMTLEDLMDKAIVWGLDGIHLTNVDLVSKDPARLAAVKKNAKDHGLYLEYNCALNEEFDPRINETFASAVPTAAAIGADLIKFGLDIRRPKPLYGSCFHPQVMRQLCDVVDQIKAALPEYERTGIRLAVENHTETFADEIIWVVEQVGHPLVGVCVDTINSFSVLEDPKVATERLAPYAFCCHFCDNELVRDQHGAHFIGVALGKGDIDNKKALQALKDLAPDFFDRINFEVEWSIGDDPLEVAQKKEMQACIDSIKYLREDLGIGVRKV
jgi:Sugar phosphate isomerases/epimerases